MPIEMTGEYTRRATRPSFVPLGADVKILALFIDAWADHNWGEFDSAMLGEAAARTPTRTDRRLQEYGVGDRHGLFTAAGLSERQRQVMEARYSEDLEGRGTPSPAEIADRLGWPSLRVRVHLHEGYDRLRKWARRQQEPLTVSLMMEGQ